MSCEVVGSLAATAHDLFEDALSWEAILAGFGPQFSPSILENQISDPASQSNWVAEQVSEADLQANHARAIELEIGCGKGLFLQSAGTQCPERLFVGIELAAKFANRAAQRIDKSQLTNVRIFRGDAQQFLRDVVPGERLQRIHVYFPDPWWRNKHKKRRVLNEQSLQDIQRSLLAGGELHFWTDVLDYYEFTCSQIMDQTLLAGPRYVPERTASHSMDYTTHFERRARIHSQPVYRAVFVKGNP